MNEKQSILSSNFGSLEEKVSMQMDAIDKKTAETLNNLKDLQHVTNTFDDKVANFAKSLRMEFRETKDDMVKKIDEHVQLDELSYHLKAVIHHYGSTIREGHYKADCLVGKETW